MRQKDIFFKCDNIIFFQLCLLQCGTIQWSKTYFSGQRRLRAQNSTQHCCQQFTVLAVQLARQWKRHGDAYFANFILHTVHCTVHSAECIVVKTGQRSAQPWHGISLLSPPPHSHHLSKSISFGGLGQKLKMGGTNMAFLSCPLPRTRIIFFL